MTKENQENVKEFCRCPARDSNPIREEAVKGSKFCIGGLNWHKMISDVRLP